MRYAVVVLAVLLVGCAQPEIEENPNADFERGMRRGYERALTDVYDCIDNPEVETAELGTCLAANASRLPGEPSEEYVDGIEGQGLLIELAILNR